MTTSIVEVIQHYQRSIDNSQDNEARLLHCIQKLYKLPIKVEHLQETGVGKTVNSLRKFNGEIGVAAKSLVTKWKAMVAAEEEPMDTTTPHSNDNESQNNNNDGHDPSPHNNVIGEEGDENQNHHNTPTQQTKHSGHSEKEKSKERHKERRHSSNSSSGNHKENSSKHTASSSSTSSKHSNEKHHKGSLSKDKESHHKSSSSKQRENEKTEHKSRDRHREKDQDKDREYSETRRDEKHKSENKTKPESSNHKNNSNSGSCSKSKSDDKHNHKSSSKEKTDKEKERPDKHKSSSKDKERRKEEKSSPSSEKDKNERKSSSSSSHKSSSTKDSSDTAERKRRHNSDTESSDFKSPQPKTAKIQMSSNSSIKTVESSSPPQEEDPDDCFDSSMGANFGDILGMLNVPKKKGKKSGKSSSCSSKDSPPKPSTSNSSTPTKVNGVNSSPSIYTPQSLVKIPTARPDLLAPTAKLAPLDPSIALELPTISTNYKPMPLNQTVMDCVFNTASSSSSKPLRTLTDAEALHHGISSKTMRTKIYSGTRTGQIFQVSSLFDMCIRILQKNIDALEYTGGVPFEVLRPVLERATPQQLFVFEDYNPYLMEDSDILWQFHVSRNYRIQKRLENESWREMFLRCQEEEERRLSILKDSIKASQKIAAAPVRKTQMAFIDSMVKPPRNVIRKQEQYGTKAKLVATPAARVAALQSVTPNAGKTGDQRLKVSPAVRDHAQVASSSIRPKKAPLMQKTLAFIRGRNKR